MKLIKMECPFCGSQLSAESTDTSVTCEYCGKMVMIDEGIVKSEHTVNIKDEAKLKEMEFQQAKYQEEKKQEKAEKYKSGKASKFVIVLIVLCVLGAFAAFRSGHPVAGIIALIQVALLTISRMIATGSITTIKNRKIPSIVFVILACLLVYPYSTILTRKVYDKYVWPNTELSALLEKPASSYGSVLVSSNDKLSVLVAKTSASAYQNYLSSCKEHGFTEEAKTGYRYEAYNTDGYLLELSHDESDLEMTIRLTAPEETQTIRWPLNDLCAQLPEPPSDQGTIDLETENAVWVTFASITPEDFSSYVDAVMNAGFTGNYERSDTFFQGENEAGDSVLLEYERFHKMTIQLEAAKEETPLPEPTPAPEPQETATPEPTAEAAPEPTAETKSDAAYVNGVRPEFRKMMEDYEAFYDKYIDFMKKYSSSDNPAGMMMDYLSMMNQLAEMQESIDSVDESELTTEELKLYNEVTMRVVTKLNNAAITMN